MATRNEIAAQLNALLPEFDRLHSGYFSASTCSRYDAEMATEILEARHLVSEALQNLRLAHDRVVSRLRASSTGPGGGS